MSLAFAAPSWSAPLDHEAYVAAIPLEAGVRGLFLTGATKLLQDAGRQTTSPRYLPFQSYPVADYARLLVHCAQELHGGVPLREGLRRVGHTSYGRFLESTIGRVIFAFAGRNPRAAVRLAPRAYDVASNGTVAVSIREDTPHATILTIRNSWSFPDCHEVGVLEGALRAFGSDARLEVLALSASGVDIRILWH